MTEYSPFGALTGPATVTVDPSPYTMGLEFDVSEICWLIGIEFWQAAGVVPSSAIRKALLYAVINESTGTLEDLGADTNFPVPVPGWNRFTPVKVLIQPPHYTSR